MCRTLALPAGGVEVLPPTASPTDTAIHVRVRPPPSLIEGAAQFAGLVELRATPVRSPTPQPPQGDAHELSRRVKVPLARGPSAASQLTLSGLRPGTSYSVVASAVFLATAPDGGTAVDHIVGPPSSPVRHRTAEPGVQATFVYRLSESLNRHQGAYAYGPHDAVPDFLSSHAAADLLAVSHFVLDAMVKKQRGERMLHGHHMGPPTLVRHCVERRDTPFEEYLSCDATVAGGLSDEELFNGSRRDAAVAARLSHTEAFACECASIHDRCLADRSIATCHPASQEPQLAEALQSAHRLTCPCALKGRCRPKGPCGYTCPCDLHAARRGVGRMRFHAGNDFLLFTIREHANGQMQCDLNGGEDRVDAQSRAQGYWYSMPAESECAPIAATNPLRSVLGIDGCSWARHDVQYVLNGGRLLASGVAASLHTRTSANMAPQDLSAEERMLADAFAEAEGRCCGC